MIVTKSRPGRRGCNDVSIDLSNVDRYLGVAINGDSGITVNQSTSVKCVLQCVTLERTFRTVNMSTKTGPASVR